MVWRQLKSIIQRLYGYYVIRPIQRWNVDNRAAKAIETEKVRPAPKHENTKELIEKMVQSHPEVKEELAKKPEDLISRLKDVKITSHGTFEVPKTEDSRLPKTRDAAEIPLYGVQEPAVVSKGKLSMRGAVELLSFHLKEPEVYTIDKICQQYNLEKDDAKNLITYFKSFKYYMPKVDAEKPLWLEMALNLAEVRKLPGMNKEENLGGARSSGSPDSEKEPASKP